MAVPDSASQAPLHWLRMVPCRGAHCCSRAGTRRGAHPRYVLMHPAALPCPADQRTRPGWGRRPVRGVQAWRAGGCRCWLRGAVRRERGRVRLKAGRAVAGRCWRCLAGRPGRAGGRPAGWFPVARPGRGRRCPGGAGGWCPSRRRGGWRCIRRGCGCCRCRCWRVQGAARAAGYARDGRARGWRGRLGVHGRGADRLRFSCGGEWKYLR